MNVLVAGDRGYIGAVLVPFLRAAGHTVEGLDLGLYEGCDIGPGPEDIGSRPRIDLRDVEARHCAEYDAVICLAALSNDPVGHLNPAATYSINLDGTLRLGTGRQEVRSRAVSLRIVMQPLRFGRLTSRLRGGRALPGHALRRDKGHGRARALPAGRRYVQPHLPAQCHGVRLLASVASRYRREQLDRRRYDDWEGSPRE